ncbi:hypothetical protein [Novipirellula aureliae]|nr:hypothetical protein [Novipirellula aureliae]
MYFSRVLLSFLVPIVVMVAIVVPLVAIDSANTSADDRAIVSINRSDDSDISRGADSLQDEPQLSANQHMREGTTVLPTTGRLLMLGRHWVFIPNQTANRNDIESSSASTRPISRSDAVETQAVDPSHAVILVENLVLQRMINAIRADSNDHTWTITAKVTEFFDENRLLLLTAQRANSR